MKPDEQWFLLLIDERPDGVSVRELMNTQQTIPAKRVVYLLYKWSSKGWYEYGVNVELGWLTDKGKSAALELRRQFAKQAGLSEFRVSYRRSKGEMTDDAEKAQLESNLKLIFERKE